MLRETTYDEPHGFAGIEQDDRPPWPAAIVTILVLVAAAAGLKHCHDKNSQHEQASSNTPRNWHEQGPKKPHAPLSPQLRLIVQIFAVCYFALLAGLIASLAIMALIQRWQRHDWDDRNPFDD